MKRVLNKRALIFSLILLILVINLNLISAAPVDDVKEFIKGLNFGFTFEDFQYYSAGSLLLILVTLLLFAVSDFVPFLSGTSSWLRFAISLIVGILSVAYLSPENIYTSLMNFKALGITMTTIVPILFLIGFTLKWDTEKTEYSFIASIMWLVYLIAFFVLYGQAFWQMISWFFGKGSLPDIGFFGIIFVPLVAIIAVAFLFAGGFIARWWFFYRLKKEIVKGKLNTDAEIVGKINTLENYKIAAPELSPKYDAMIKELQKARRRLGPVP